MMIALMTVSCVSSSCRDGYWRDVMIAPEWSARTAAMMVFFSGFGVIVVGCVVFLFDWTIFSVENCYFLSSGLHFIMEHSFANFILEIFHFRGVKIHWFPSFSFPTCAIPVHHWGSRRKIYPRATEQKHCERTFGMRLLRKALPAALAMHVAFSTHFSRIRTHLRNWHRTKLTTHGLLRW